jgi:3-hydroxyisobutyrate dehydrogenase-like beta-hydroxyacid dehydrogenase
VIDAPVSGGPTGADAGTLTAFVGGRAEDVDRAAPVLESFAANVFHLGPIGSGLVAKTINNVLCAANIHLMAEGCRIAHMLGLDLEHLTVALDEGSGRNFMTRGSRSVAEILGAYTDDRAGFDAIMATLRKDTKLGRELAAEAGGEFPAIGDLSTTVSRLGDETFDTWKAIASTNRRRRPGLARPARTKSIERLR